MKILIAEDNAFSRTLLKKTLAKAGYEVIAVEKGDAAWEVLQEDNPPKLALIDWMMPGMSGTELCRKIRGISRTFPTYIILLTAKTAKEDVLEGFAAGADDFIKKPFDSGELLARIQVGRRLVEQHALLHGLIDAIPDPIYYKDSRGLYLGCNKAYSEFVGKEEDEIVSCTSADLFSSDDAQSSHMEDLRVLANGESVEKEGWALSADGRKVYHSTLKFPYLESDGGSTGMIGIKRDLTNRIAMEQEMRRLAVAVEQSTESIMITDLDHEILYVNSAFEKTTGYAPEEVLGMSSDMLNCDQHDDHFYEKLRNTITAGNTWSGQMTRLKKDGNFYDEEAVIYPIRDESDNVVNFVTISRDITQEMAIEKQLRQRQKMNAIGELAGGVSHDFNNILAAILGYVALCMNSLDEDSKPYSYLQEVLKAGDRATKLVRQILTFSRQEEQVFQPMELQGVIEDSLGMVQTTMKRTIDLKVDIDPNCGSILGDPTQIQQVVVNLCTNAVHALAEEESGCLDVSLKQVEVLGKKIDDKTLGLDPGLYCCITVKDTGSGMPPEVIERIFEPYFTTKKKGEGTGFGLSIVHGIVRKHRGSIMVDSEIGKGTTFTVYLPLLIGTAAQKQKAIDESTPEGYGRILLVDDDQMLLSMGREMLESFGYSVVTATNGRRALETFRQDPSGFDALVSDYSMPEMNGHELIRESLALRADLPAILCSGYMEKVSGEDLENLGHTAFLSKPIDWRELSRCIQREINKQLS